MFLIQTNKPRNKTKEMEPQCVKCISTASNNSCPIDVEKFRKCVRNYLDKHLYLAAEFWADKLVTVNGSAPLDVYYLAQCYFFTQQYHRAILLLNNHNLTKNATCRYLVGRCHYEAGEHLAALDVLDQVTKSCIIPNRTETGNLSIPEIDDPTIESSIHLLRGYISEATENRLLAAESFQEALKIDPLCFEAFHALSQHHMLPLREEKDLISSLPLKNVCNETEEAFVKTAYESRLNKYSGVKIKTQMTFPSFETNLDYCTSQAEKLYYQCDFIQCYKLTQNILQKDPYHPECLPVHIACLVELKKPNALFLLGHKLVDMYPENATSWFAVGCYYYLIGKNDHARRFLSKSTSINRVFGPAWIAYGHSFAAENEHDQARAAYYKAAQLMKGCHLPLLYIGMEYSLINNPKFAEKFFKEALQIADDDPFVHHELGVVAYTNHAYSKAESYFQRAVAAVEKNRHSVVPEKWATLLNNLGQTYCKLGKYEESLELHRHALRSSPGSASSYASIGLVQSYMGDYQEAIVSLHKALSIQRDHTVASTLLSNLMHLVIVCSSPFEGDEGVMAFDLINIESTTSGSGFSNKAPTPCDSVDDVKQMLATIGRPVMHSSDVTGDSTNHPRSADSSAMFIEDMVMDDDSP